MRGVQGGGEYPEGYGADVSEIVRVIERGTYVSCPRLLVRCKCGRTYVTTQTLARARSLRSCKMCTEALQTAAQRARAKYKRTSRSRPGGLHWGSDRWRIMIRALPNLTRQRLGFT